jgi:hypothetical protein
MPSEIHGDVSRYDPKPFPAISSYNDAVSAPATPLSARERLKQAFASVEAARSAFQTAQALAVRAANMHEDAKARFSKLQSAEHDIREWKVAAFKSGSSEPMPPDLLEARREAIHAAEELQHADAVAGQMSNELAAAERAFQDAEKFKREAASLCVLDAAKIVIEEIRQLGERRNYLRNILRGASIAAVSMDQSRAFETLKANAMHDPSMAQLAFPPAAPGATKYWANYSQALLSDPAAMLGEPPAADKLW